MPERYQCKYWRNKKVNAHDICWSNFFTLLPSKIKFLECTWKSIVRNDPPCTQKHKNSAYKFLYSPYFIIPLVKNILKPQYPITIIDSRESVMICNRERKYFLSNDSTFPLIITDRVKLTNTMIWPMIVSWKKYSADSQNQWTWAEKNIMFRRRSALSMLFNFSYVILNKRSKIDDFNAHNKQKNYESKKYRFTVL